MHLIGRIVDVLYTKAAEKKRSLASIHTLFSSSSTFHRSVIDTRFYSTKARAIRSRSMDPPRTATIKADRATSCPAVVETSSGARRCISLVGRPAGVATMTCLASGARRERPQDLQPLSRNPGRESRYVSISSLSDAADKFKCPSSSQAANHV